PSGPALGRPRGAGSGAAGLGGAALPRAPAPAAGGRAFVPLAGACPAYGRRRVAALRRRAIRTAERWIVERQERDGSWGGIQPPWVWSMVALHELGYGLDHPVMRRALSGLDSFTLDDDLGRRLEACQSPGWDTAPPLVALP